ncbi:tRNA (adenine-N(1)-)-methyltransferase catalytic subunit trm61 [Tulasnella sp. 427]|nr:tRNA (adenine-N(1)-)-methyltransferase catalytic subunit trm61 [Tulasnella sp. 427]
MFGQAREIASGDVVIIWFTRESLKAITIAPGEELNGRFGAYRHVDLIGKPFGSKIGSRNGKGFIYVLRPTPELWTLALPHRTQILYVADIAFVISWLGIKPGSVVIEAGTGSGSFSHSVARTIGKSGRLHSFEFHETRCQAAQEEFAHHGMSEYVTVSHRNVCKTGFDLEDAVDAVFLDLPAPWEAIPAAKQALKKTQSTRICCFSPCAEQVLRTVSALNDSGFTSITMYETLIRTIDVGSYPPSKSVGTVADKLKDADVKREARRVRQIEDSALRAKEKSTTKTGESGPQNMDVSIEELERPHGQKRKAGDDLTGSPPPAGSQLTSTGRPAQTAQPPISDATLHLRNTLISTLEDTSWPRRTTAIVQDFLTLLRGATNLTNIPKEEAGLSDENRRSLNELVRVLEDARPRLERVSATFGAGTRRTMIWKRLKHFFTAVNRNQCVQVLEFCRNEIERALVSLPDRWIDENATGNNVVSGIASPHPIPQPQITGAAPASVTHLTQTQANLASPTQTTPLLPLNNPNKRSEKRQERLDGVKTTCELVEGFALTIPVVGSYVGAAAKVGSKISDIILVRIMLARVLVLQSDCALQKMGANEETAKALESHASELGKILGHFEDRSLDQRQDALTIHMNQLQVLVFYRASTSEFDINAGVI